MMPQGMRETLRRHQHSHSDSNVDLKLYYHPHSFYSQKVIMALLEKCIPFTTSYVNILNGKQFTNEFLHINPRGEVPVLVDDNTRYIPDSAQIMDYLEDNFSNGYTRLRPDEPDLRVRCDHLSQLLNELKVESLAFGTGVHAIRDLNINPRPPYCVEKERAKIREVVDHRRRILRTEAKKFPFAADALNQKLKEIEKDLPVIKDRDQYEGLILTFEKVLDECEAELTSHEDQTWWLVSPSITLADVHLSILLYRLWLLGFEKRMWERTRPSVEKYFNRIRRVESFRKATSMTEGFAPLLDFLRNPYAWAALGTAAVFLGAIYVGSRTTKEGLFGFLDGIGSCADCPVHGGQGAAGPGTFATSPSPSPLGYMPARSLPPGPMMSPQPAGIPYVRQQGNC